MSTPPDKDFLSYSGDAQGNIWRNGDLIVAGPRHTTAVIVVGDVIPPDDTYADSLKISGVIDAVFKVGKLVGSREDCVDINHSHAVSVFIDLAQPKGTYVATIKGGSTDIDVFVTKQEGHGTETDYDLGSFTEASQDKTTGVHIDVAEYFPGTPVVRVINADKPITNGLKVYKPWWAYWPFWAIYVTLRLHGIIPS